LESAVPGGVQSRPSDRLGRAHDASHFVLTPHAVVTPTGTDQIVGLLRACAQQGVSLTFRSGGTSLSGQATADGVLIDTRRNFRTIEVLDDGRRVRVEPGATLRAVNDRLAPYHRVLGPDPASEVACTIGGVIANNSSGMACGTEFNTYRTLESAVLVLPSGTVIDTGDADADDRLRALEPTIHDGLLRLRDRVRSSTASRATIATLYSIKNTMGYGLNAFVDHDRAIDILLHLIVGSEGTLAFVASATFRTLPTATHAATGLLIFDDLEAATGALPDIVDAQFAIVELLDSTSLRVAQRDPRAIDALRHLDVRSHTALLVEHRLASRELLRERVRASQPLLESLALTSPLELTMDAATRDALWHIRKGLYAMVAGNRPSGTSALLEDIAVPVPVLLAACRGLVSLFERHHYVDSVIFGHAKDGNLHFMLCESFEDPSSLERYIAFTDEMVDLVLAHGGTLKAEHGTGRMMTPFVRRQYGDELYEVMREIKRLIDPSGLLNPGVLLNEDATAYITNLKVARTVEAEVDRCIECGYCEPVCPSKDLTLTPRTRIVLRREMANAKADGDDVLLKSLTTDYDYDGIETCAVDGMCEVACPVHINVGDLVKRLRSDGRHGFEETVWRFAAHHWHATTTGGGVAMTMAKRVPAPLATGVTKLARAVVGAERMPLWEPDLPTGGKVRVARSPANPKAVYFPACLGTLFGPVDGARGVTWAFLEICRRAEVNVIIPEGIENTCCATPWTSKGLSEGFALMRERVVPMLWEASDNGRLPVVCDASSCTQGVTRLIDSAAADGRVLRVMDVVEYTDERIMPRLAVRSKVGSLAFHPNCSSVQLDSNLAAMRIAAAIATEVVIPDEWGCCAFAGDRGMLHPELTASATRREAASLTSRAFDVYASTNRTCELGMTRSVGHSFEHLIETVERVSR
jgi:D-lactate dehydrogenase